MRKIIILAMAGAVASIPGIASAATDGKNRKVHVENMSNHTMRELYASPVTAKTWEENLLGQRTLESGKSIYANIDNGTNDCYYDLKAVMDNGNVLEKRSVDVCATTKWIIGETQNITQ
jgi:hypothetical protein